LATLQLRAMRRTESSTPLPTVVILSAVCRPRPS